MNILDYAILAIFLFFILRGVYKGFISTLISIVAYIAAWLAAIVLIGVVSDAVRGSAELFNTMLYYTEGSEYIGDVELAKTDIADIGTDELNAIIIEAELPYPMGKAITENIALEEFAPEGIHTLGDYFNQTIVRVFINILSFLAVFGVVRLILVFIINGVDFAWHFPLLREHDALLGAGMGLVRGILAVFLLYMLLPIVLVVLAGKLSFVTDMLESSFFSHFFYRTNFLLSMMPGA